MHIIPTHQGRAAERILFERLGGAGKFVTRNNHFDTTRANIEYSGATALALVIAESRASASLHPFKGNRAMAQREATLQGAARSIFRRVC